MISPLNLQKFDVKPRHFLVSILISTFVFSFTIGVTMSQASYRVFYTLKNKQLPQNLNCEKKITFYDLFQFMISMINSILRFVLRLLSNWLLEIFLMWPFFNDLNDKFLLTLRACLIRVE